MDDIVAVAVELESGESRYFLTWGRIQGSPRGHNCPDFSIASRKRSKQQGQPLSGAKTIQHEEGT